MTAYAQNRVSSTVGNDAEPMHVGVVLDEALRRIFARARHRAIVDQCERPAECEGTQERHDAAADDRGALV